MKKLLLPFSLVFILIVLSAVYSAGFQKIEKIKFHLTSRTASKGKKTITEADIYYVMGGRMLTHFSVPLDQVVINYPDGRMIIYDPGKNSARQMVGNLYSTESNILFNFLERNYSDLGLGKMGFSLKESKHQEQLLITKWFPPIELAGKMGVLELVYEDSRPIYIGYTNSEGKIVNKTYFYQYETFGSVTIPKAITTISYSGEKDSVISKTSISKVQVTGLENEEYFKFQVPDDAKEMD